MRPTPSNDWLLWQIADSAFPTGSFVHSGGLEAASQYGELRERENLPEFLEAAIGQTGSSSLPFVRAAFERDRPLITLDSMCDAFTSNHVANRASRLQGRAFLNSAERAFASPSIAALREEFSKSASHFAPVFGAICGLLDFGLKETLRLFLFTHLRGWMSSAVRLNLIGPLEAQSLQLRLVPYAESTLALSEQITLDAVAQTAPLMDIFQGGHDRLYSRLFQS